MYQKLDDATKFIQEKLIREEHLPLANPRVMIICGSGLGGISSALKGNLLELAYKDIPGFRASTVTGHSGKLVFGLIGDKNVPVMCMVGRLQFHFLTLSFYEGYDFKEVTFPVRVAANLGVSCVIATNAAGGVNSRFIPGDLMVIDDHINFPGFAGHHPLRGPNFERFGPRFQPLSDAYDLALRKLVFEKAKELEIHRSIHEGVYFYTSGPTFESRAEVRMIRVLGGDAVGMSTVPETVVARHCGMRVLALSLITNAGVGDPPAKASDPMPKPLNEGMASHAEVLQHAVLAATDVERLIEGVVNEL